MKLLITICDRGHSDKIIKTINHGNPNLQFLCLGKGTANSQMLDYFGIGSSEKDIILSFVEDEAIADVFEKLATKERFTKHGGAVAFTISISSIGKKTLDLIRNMEEVINNG